MTLLARPGRSNPRTLVRGRSCACRSCGKPKPPSSASEPACSVSRRVRPSHARRGEPSIVNMAEPFGSGRIVSEVFGMIKQRQQKGKRKLAEVNHVDGCDAETRLK